jgi:voltage-gated potassium channel
MIIGVGMFGYVVGNIAHILMNLYPSRARYVETMERLNAFMAYRKLPAGLQQRIRAYYSYMWEQRMGYDEGSIIAGLPPGLAGEVSMYLKRDVIEKVPFFRGASEAFIRDVALATRPMIYMPDDVVCRAGDPADEMFFIGRGTIQVLSRDEQHVQATLRDGDFFGEMSLVMGTPRTASVKATEYCDLYALDKSSFDRIMLRYPEFADHIRTMVEERGGGTKP